MITTARLLTARLPVTVALVGAVVAAGQFAVPDGAFSRLWTDGAQAIGGGVAAALCLNASRDRTGPARRWRQVVAAGLGVWTLMRVWWLVADLMKPDRPAVMTVADVGFLILPIGVLIALMISAATLPRRGPTSAVRDRVVLLIDSVLIGGSMIAVTWTALPARVLDGIGGSRSVVGVAVAYPVADLILATMAVLLLATRPASGHGRVPIWLIAGAMVSFGASDALRLVFLAEGALTPVQAAGALLGPALLALAALRPPSPADATEIVRPDADWPHLLLPYVPVVASGVVIAMRTGDGARLTPFEAYLGWLGLGLVVARQMFTIVDNTILLHRVSEGKDRLRRQAYHDPLTGLANRALFNERVIVALNGHRHRGRPLALLFADLDDFKLINDSFGHAMGDRLLRAVAERLQECVPAEDLVARLSGDEFAVLLEHHADAAEPIGQSILAALREPFELDGQTVGVGASIGLVVPDPADPAMTADIVLAADTLLRRADAAMYASKRRGKGTIATYAAGGSDGGPHADLPHLLARALSAAPADSGFEVYYQPIVRFSDWAIVAVEALARWTDPVHGPVDPDVFVTVAERTGLVSAIDEFVLDRACADAAGLANTYGRPIDVHVNVSAARLGQQGLEESIVRALERHAVRPSRLVVEITETRRIPDLPHAAAVASRLRAYGVRIALDDFGSGYNALAQLHSLPVDIVKLDATLTDIDVAPAQAAALCHSVLAICTELNVAVVAEGIETPSRAHALADLGCRFGQGYLFGQPVPVHRLQSGPVPAPRRASHLTA